MSLSPVRSSPTWHDAQPISSNVSCPRAGVGPADVATGRDGERARVEGHLVELVVVELGVATVGGAEALGLEAGARLLGPQARRDADVAGERAGVLLLDAGDGRLPPEASEGLVARVRRIRHEVRPPGDAVAVLVVGVGADRGCRPPARPRAGRPRTPRARCAATAGARRSARRRARSPRSAVRRGCTGVPSSYAPSTSTGVTRRVPSTGTPRMARSCSCEPRSRWGIGPPVSSRTLSADQQARARGRPASAGGWARPSRKWHEEHDWALKSGPSPSRPSVEAGAVTQLSLKKLLPTAKSRRCWLSRPGTGWAKAPLPAISTVASPPWSASCLVGGRLRRVRRRRHRRCTRAGAGWRQPSRQGGTTAAPVAISPG